MSTHVLGFQSYFRPVAQLFLGYSGPGLIKMEIIYFWFLHVGKHFDFVTQTVS